MSNLPQMTEEKIKAINVSYDEYGYIQAGNSCWSKDNTPETLRKQVEELIRYAANAEAAARFLETNHYLEKAKELFNVVYEGENWDLVGPSIKERYTKLARYVIDGKVY